MATAAPQAHCRWRAAYEHPSRFRLCDRQGAEGGTGNPQGLGRGRIGMRCLGDGRGGGMRRAIVCRSRVPVSDPKFRDFQQTMAGQWVGMVLRERIELSTSPLPRECSTTELPQRTGWALEFSKRIIHRPGRRRASPSSGGFLCHMRGGRARGRCIMRGEDVTSPQMWTGCTSEQPQRCIFARAHGLSVSVSPASLHITRPVRGT